MLGADAQPVPAKMLTSDELARDSFACAKSHVSAIRDCCYNIAAIVAIILLLLFLFEQ